MIISEQTLNLQSIHKIHSDIVLKHVLIANVPVQPEFYIVDAWRNNNGESWLSRNYDNTYV